MNMPLFVFNHSHFC